MLWIAAIHRIEVSRLDAFSDRTPAADTDLAIIEFTNRGDFCGRNWRGEGAGTFRRVRV